MSKLFKIKLQSLATDLSLPIRKRDAVVTGDGDGVQFLLDFANAYSYAGGPPLNDTPVADVADRAAAGRIVKAAGQTLDFAGNGIDFAGITASGGGYVELPASIAASIWGGGVGPQYFLQALWLRLPTQANWWDGSGVTPFSCFTTSGSGYTASADLVTIGQLSASQQITARRQRNGASTVDTLTIAPKAADYGALVQLAFWRNAAGQGLRLRSANGTELATLAVGAANTGDFSARKAVIGAGPSFFASKQGARAWKLYRGWIENLALSGRDPIAVLDGDFARVVGRTLGGFA